MLSVPTNSNCSSDLFHQSPQPENLQGRPRKVGFELELSGIKLRPLADEIVSVFGGRLTPHAPLCLEIETEDYGVFRAELDSQMVQKAAEEISDKGRGKDRDKDREKGREVPQKASADDEGSLFSSLMGEPRRWYRSASRQASKTASTVMTGVAEIVVPYEIVTPPLPLSAFPKLAALVDRLHMLEAEGTRASFVNAFGMHLNPEIYSDEADEIRDVLRAFLLLYPYLKAEMEIDLSRRVLTYIDPFPKDYVQLVLSADYAPELQRLIEDYLTFNPTRNRALDLLPLFAHLAPDYMAGRSEVDMSLVKPRPTFHYRLPNCEIDNPCWNIHRDWNLWVEVERLALDKPRLARLSEDYLAFLTGPLNRLFVGDWAAHAEKNVAAAAAVRRAGETDESATEEKDDRQ